MASKSSVWRKVPQSQFPEMESFLRKHEPVCVGACSRFIQGNSHIWTYSINSEIAAFMLYCRRSLYPVFSGNHGIPLPGFFSSFLQKINIHSVTGLREDIEITEEGMRDRGYCISDRIDYDLMALERPASENLPAGPPDLVLRKPAEADRDDLFRLQCAYEQEEVIPLGGYFNPDNCGKILARILASEQMLVACVGNKIVGKINTNAKSFTRYQIGGVYVCPEYRGRGIASRMSAAFLNQLAAEGRGITLFVKKRNIAAKNVYKRLGFTVLADYRICYY